MLDGVEIVGSSPELLVRVSAGGTVTVRPIAGTRRRGRTAEDDAAMTAELHGRRKGARRARDARRPRPQRRGPNREVRIGARERADGRRAVLARAPPREPGRRRAARRAHRDGRVSRRLSRRHDHRRAQGARDADHRRDGARAARAVRRRRRLHQRRREAHGPARSRSAPASSRTASRRCSRRPASSTTPCPSGSFSSTRTRRARC